MVFAISLLTYNSGLGLCAGAAVAHSASATTLEARAAIRYLPDAMSVVEDRLVSIEGLVEPPDAVPAPDSTRSEEHTSELQSLAYLVCRLLLEKKKKNTRTPTAPHIS